MHGKSCGESEYKHDRGAGGAGGSPTKFVKREATLESKYAMYACGHLKDRNRGCEENFD